jgi:hypothetical protein
VFYCANPLTQHTDFNTSKEPHVLGCHEYNKLAPRVEAV